MKRSRSLTLSILAFWGVMVLYSFAQGGGVTDKTFATWDDLEVDKLASIWLIERFIKPGTHVVLHPKGSIIREGIQFDTPMAEIKRIFNQSAYESLLAHFKISDIRLVNIGRLIHDIEINSWEKKLYRRTASLQIFYLDLLNSGLSQDEMRRRSSTYLDRLYQEIEPQLDKLDSDNHSP